MKNFRCIFITVLSLYLGNQHIYGQLTEEDLAKIAQDPIANIISIPFQNNTTFGIGPFDRTLSITNLQPVIPMADGKIIARVILPIVNQPNVFAESGNFNGIGDVNLSVFYTKKGKVSWGVGPVFNLPTAGDNLGIQEWGVGPSVVGVVKPSNWVIGMLINNVWSLESDNAAFTVQPFINYNLPNGYYLSTSPKVVANWQADSDNRWTIPVGIGFGKIVKPKGFLPFNIQVGADYLMESPELSGGDWTFKFTFTALIPKVIFKKKASKP
ncbi:neuromedin U [Muricauda sp. JGD-17]|uniref:Neuromedin U n=1 Tax=Flagellimonas ochracea TaxID=2696472 RepID=A0A964WWY9_9FLAO|nr:neuromedin U [Allomuricauda ochracea]NAY91297.1 neuromedin U [Allomuricauda ochracea]